MEFIQILHAAVVCSLSLLNSMPLDEYTKFYLSVLLVMGIWVVSSIGLLQIISWPVCAWISADCTFKIEIVRSLDMDIFSSGKHSQTDFQHGCVDLHSHQYCIRALTAPHPYKNFLLTFSFFNQPFCSDVVLPHCGFNLHFPYYYWLLMKVDML